MTDLWLTDARVPVCLLDGDVAADGDGLARVDVAIADGRIAAVAPAGATRSGTVLDASGSQVWPCPVDVHSHLDKGHTWPRAENPDGTFAGALAATAADREAHWSAADVRARMAFGLACAYAHGTKAVRTHLDSIGKQTAITWPVFAELREAWAGRVALQGVSLSPIDMFADDEAVRVADTVADHGGVLGAVTYMVPEVDRLIDRVIGLAADRGLDLDFHVDETLDPGARTLDLIARAVVTHGFSGTVLVGHCCSLATQPAAVAAATLDRVAEAGIAVVTLPMCNLYLQDRAPGRTPRQRGVTLLHEMAARGIPVAAASDNCRDPFYGYGDHDMVEVFREAVRIGHLDRPVGNWPRAVTATPAAIMGLADSGRIAVGQPADLVLFRARYYSELLARPQAGRVVLRAGQAIDAAPPDYRQLDPLFDGGSDDTATG
ncbi:MAG: cytosine deaminase [Alphaproteobacteria bacterium]